VRQFEFRAELFGRPDEDGALDAGEEPREGAWDGASMETWANRLSAFFRESPEGQGFTAGWVDHFLMGQLNRGLHPADVANV